MLKSKKIVDWLYNYSLYFIIGALLLVIIAIEPSFVRVSNFTTILTQSATKIIYACGIAGIIVLGGTDLALGREVGLAAVVAASLLQAVDYSQRVFSADQVPALPLIVPLLLVMVLLGIICAAHGFIVAHWGVAPFVASLGVQLISYGLCLQYFNTVCKANPNVSEQVLHFFSTGAIQGDKLVTHTFPLEDYEKAVDIFEHKKDGSIKVVINP